MQTNFDNLFGELRRSLTPRARDEFSQFVGAPEIKNVIERQDAQLQAERKKLIGDLAAAPERHRKRLAEAAAAMRKAEERERQAVAEVAAAHQACGAARSLLGGLAVGADYEMSNITRKLIDTSDSRLLVLRDHLDGLQQTLRNSAHCMVIPNHRQRDDFGNRLPVEFATNKPELDKALAAVERTRKAVEGLQMAAISRKEIDNALRAMLFELNTALVPFDMAQLTLDDAGSIVWDRSTSSKEATNAILRAAGAGAADLFESAVEVRSRERDLMLRNQSATI